MSTPVATETRPGGQRRVAAEARVPRARLTLVTVGVPPARLFAEQTRTAGVRDVDTDDNVEQLLKLATRATARDGHAVVLYPHSLPERARRRLVMVRSMLAERRVALCPVALPPVGASVVTAAVSSVLDRARYPGAIAALVDHLPDQVAAFTCLSTVAGLRDPVPSLGQRLASITPGSEFVVTHRPFPHLTRVTRRRPSVPMPAMRQPLGLVTTEVDADGWVSRFLRPALGDPALIVVEPDANPSTRRGRRVVDAVVFPLRLPESAARLLQGLADRVCGWCGELVATERCPFCHMHGPAAA